MEIIIRGETKEITDFVVSVQSRRGDSNIDYEALKKRLENDICKEIEQTYHSPFTHL